MARAGLRLSVRDLAKAASVSPNTVTRIEGDHAANTSTLAAIQQSLEALGVQFLANEQGEPAGVLIKRPVPSERGP